jgi:hypothetical protein
MMGAGELGAFLFCFVFFSTLALSVLLLEPARGKMSALTNNRNCPPPIVRLQTKQKKTRTNNRHAQNHEMEQSGVPIQRWRLSNN